MSAQIANNFLFPPLLFHLEVSKTLSPLFVPLSLNVSTQVLSLRASQRIHPQVETHQAHQRSHATLLSTLENPHHAFKLLQFWYMLSVLLGLPFVFVFFPFPLSSFVLKVVDRYSVPTCEPSFFHSGDQDRGLVSRITNWLSIEYSIGV